jgi:hypothetical protein
MPLITYFGTYFRSEVKNEATKEKEKTNRLKELKESWKKEVGKIKMLEKVEEEKNGRP